MPPAANDTLASNMPTMPPTPPAVPAAPSIADLQAQLAAAQAQAAAAQIPVPQVAVAPPVEVAPVAMTFPAPPVPSAPVVPQGVPAVPSIPAPPVVAAPPAPVGLPPLVAAPSTPAAPAIPTAPTAAPTVAVAPPITAPVAMPSTTTVEVPSGGLTNLGAQMEAMQGSGGGGGLFERFRGHDLSQVQTNNFRLLPVDVPAYEGRITKAELGQSSTGFPQMILSVKTYFPGIHAGISIKTYITLQPNSMWVWKSLLEAVGLLGPQGQCLADGAADFVGRAVQFQVKHDLYDGAPRNKIAGGFAAAQYTDEVPAATGQPQIPCVVPMGTPQVNWSS